MRSSDEVSVCSRTFAYPPHCPCCGDDATNELAIRFQPTGRRTAADSARHILFPYCDACVEHVGIWETASAMSSLVVSSGVVGGFAVGLLAGAWYGVFVFATAVALAILATSIIQSHARTRCGPTCATAAPAIAYLGWSGHTSTFAFASPGYAARFAAANADDAMPPVWFGLPFPRSAADWIEDLDAQPSRIARRCLLVRALGTTGDDDARRAMAEAVAHAELNPLFAELESLARASRRQRLERAIADARADNLPDELRDAKLRALTSRTFEVG